MQGFALTVGLKCLGVVGVDLLAFFAEVRPKEPIVLPVQETCVRQQGQAVRRPFWMSKRVVDQSDPRLQKRTSRVQRCQAAKHLLINPDYTR